MGHTSSKKKFKLWKLLIWIVVIFVALNIITDGEFSQQLDSLFEDTGSYQPDISPQPGYLGIVISDKEGITGGYISQVKVGFPGADSGLLAGDIIVTVGNKSINSYDDAVAELSTFYAGDSTVFTVLRDGQYVTLEIVFGIKPEESTPVSTGPQQSVPSITPPVSTNPPASTNPPVTTPPQADRLPSVPAELRQHVYLNSRDWGYCEKLIDNVSITAIFVNDPEGSWSDEEINTVKNELQSVVSRITADASSYGAQVNISMYYKTASTSVKIVDGETEQWAESALTAAGLPSLSQVNITLESTYGTDAAPVIFIANHGGRATAYHHTSKNEYAVLYENANAFYHELCHVFGAKDFYFPADVKKSAETYIPNSIMVDSSDGVMEDLTAYLIGWTDTPSQNALGFLNATSYLTKEYLAAEKEKEAYTGYVTDFTYGGGSYTGYLVRGVKHGQGKWVREDGTVWEGTFHYGKFTGTGNFIYESGAVYNGQWVNGKLHGKGTMTWENGDIYTGDFAEGKRTGKGTMTWADGAKYTGDFVDNKRTGQGTWTGSTGNSYTGSFLDGSFHGQGTYKWADGGSYTGNFENGKHSGQGTRVYADGAIYVGQWADGKRNGSGKLTYANGAVYEGNWLAGNRHGKGTHTNANGDTYTGDWVENKRSGQGTLSYKNGNVYTGSWANDTWNGEGTFTWTSGDKYVGAFVDGKRHGYGIYYYPNGARYEGNWANGDQHGQGTMYYANGTTKSGNWNNGEYVG